MKNDKAIINIVSKSVRGRNNEAALVICVTPFIMKVSRVASRHLESTNIYTILYYIYSKIDNFEKSINYQNRIAKV